MIKRLLEWGKRVTGKQKPTLYFPRPTFADLAEFPPEKIGSPMYFQCVRYLMETEKVAQ